MTAESERAAIVAWLRGEADAQPECYEGALVYSAFFYAAAMIERCDHIKEFGND